jgi:FkbM family methyltransferase
MPLKNKIWSPPLTWQEKLKNLLPGGLYLKYLLKKNLLKGEQELKMLPFLVDRSRNAIDVGANKGVYSQALSHLTNTVYAFEPNPKMYEILCSGKTGRTKAYQVALSNQNGIAKLLIPHNLKKKTYSNQGASLSSTKVSGNHKSITVEAKTLDSYNFKNIGFIKIDVEGFELSVIEGAVQTITNNQPTMLVELEERHTGISIELLVAHIEVLGYEAYFLKNSNLTSFSQFDPERMHRRALGTENYIFNFIFFPTSKVHHPVASEAIQINPNI